MTILAINSASWCVYIISGRIWFSFSFITIACLRVNFVTNRTLILKHTEEKLDKHDQEMIKALYVIVGSLMSGGNFSAMHQLHKKGMFRLALT